ncbi:MAG: hypothetical protein AAF446_11000 [Pseudomonadota bacterium]
MDTVYRHGKGRLREQGIEDARAGRAQARFEARELRLEQIKTERRKQREQREQKLQQPQVAMDEVQAAIARAKQKKAGDIDGGES